MGQKRLFLWSLSVLKKTKRIIISKSFYCCTQLIPALWNTDPLNAHRSLSGHSGHNSQTLTLLGAWDVCRHWILSICLSAILSTELKTWIWGCICLGSFLSHQERALCLNTLGCVLHRRVFCAALLPVFAWYRSCPIWLQGNCVRQNVGPAYFLYSVSAI